MSYFEISDKLDIVSKHLQGGGKLLFSLCAFLRSFKSSTDSYTEQLRSHLSTFNSDLKGQNMDTLNAGLCSFSESISKLLPVHSEFAASLSKDLLEPLELFSDHFTQNNFRYIDSGAELEEKLAREKSLLDQFKTQYMQAGASGEPALIETARDAYADRLASLKSFYEQRDKSMIEIMAFLQKSEESRINFVKLSLEKYTAHFFNWTKQSALTAKHLSGAVANINAAMDVRIFVDINKSKPEPREEFVSYEEWKKMYLTNEELIAKVVENLVSNDSSDTEASLNSVDCEPSSAEYSKLSEIFLQEDGRLLFIETLYNRRQKQPTTPERLAQLGAIVKCMLNYLDLETSKDHFCICKLLHVAQNLFTDEKWSLFDFIKDHELWQDKNVWIQIIEKSVQGKLEADREVVKRTKAYKKKSFFSTIKDFASEVFYKTDDRALKGATYTVTSQYLLFMVKIGLKPTLATEVVLDVTSRAELDEDRTCGLLAELKINLNPPFKPSKSFKLIEKWGKLPALAMAVRFLSVSDLLNVLLVCKDWNQEFKLKLSEALIDKNREDLRSRCWVNILTKESPSVDYQDCLQSDFTCISELVSVIDMDAARSYRNNPVITIDALKNILKSVAFHNSEVGYCQGMNYIAGTLFIQLQDEGLVFKCMLGMFEKYEMKELFKKDLPRLKQFFYQLDRLIGIMLPKINYAFREAGLSSGHFASSWFITIFAGTFQDNPSLLMVIWDLFIAKGWKTIFQVALFILNSLAPQIILGTFDDIMLALSTACRVEFKKDELKQFKVKNRLLDALKQEYESLKILKD